MKDIVFDIGLNIPYFLEHADDIINNTDVLLPESPFGEIRFSEHEGLYNVLRKKHLHETGNWFAFGRGKFFCEKGEDENIAEARVALGYCEATGHWDLFKWCIWEKGQQKELDVKTVRKMITPKDVRKKSAIEKDKKNSIYRMSQRN